jgi:plastocyanin
MHAHKHSIIIGALAVIALVAAACTPDDSEAGGTPPEGDWFVDVTLTEFAIDMPASAPEGEVTFRITNEGDMDHGFVVEGDGVDEQIVDSVRPGTTETLTVALAPGTYTAWCPIGDHRAQGMEAQIEITMGRDDADAPLGDEGVEAGEQEEIDAGG